MKTLLSTTILTTVLALVLYALPVTMSRADEKAVRGDYPRCQEDCLIRLQNRMTQLSEEYRKVGDRLRYQESVERARLDFDSCVENCKELIPVK
jgi:hypothetical protein